MRSIELKLNIHKIVDGIQNEQLLQSLYDFLKIKEKSKTGEHWASLSNEQKKEVLMAYDESEDEGNLVSKEKVFRKSK
ncbi:MAG: hypothetical protein WDN75_18065 [Bacteroidota bacterium]